MTNERAGLGHGSHTRGAPPGGRSGGGASLRATCYPCEAGICTDAADYRRASNASLRPRVT